MFSVAIIRDWRKQCGDDDLGPLDVRVTVDRKSYYISTGVKVLSKHWAGAVVARPDADALNNRLGIIVRRVNEKVNEYIEARQPIDVSAVREFVYSGTKVDGKQDRMLTWIESQIDALQVSDGTRRHYCLLLERLKEYGKLRSWADLTVEAIYDWDAWLHNTVKAQVKKGEDERNGSDGTIYNYHKHLKAMLNRAHDFGLISASPYDRLRGKFKKGEDENIEYLTEEQMRLILDTHPVPGTQMETVRDLFVFQMFTGMAYSDMQAFDIRQYKEETVRDRISGKKTKRFVYRGERVKTGVPFVGVLLPPVVDVLERHGWQIPQMPNQKYNCLLKTFGAVIGIDGLHSHLARHTFATYMLSKGAKVQNVMRMLGHKKIDLTMRYAKVIAKDVQDDFDMVGESFK
jgi:site-specific recombinase XerD